MVGLFLDNNSYHFHYFGKRKTIVLLNGLFASFQSWDSVIKDLVKDFNVLQLNFHGQGVLKFEDLSKVSLECHVQQVASLINQLEIEKACFLGLSHGGRVALGMASLYPHLVESLIVANTYLNPDQALYSKLNSWLLANEEVGGQHRFEVALPWVWGRTFLEQNKELIQFYKERSHLIDIKLSSCLIEQAKEEFPFDFSNFSGSLYVVSSNEDLLTPYFYQQEIMSREDIQGTSFHFEIDGGHASLIEFPQQTIDLCQIWNEHNDYSKNEEVNNVV